MDPLGPGPLPGEGGLERVAVGGLAAGLALHEPDGPAVRHVDGGEQFEAGGLRHQICSEDVLAFGPGRNRTPAEQGRGSRSWGRIGTFSYMCSLLAVVLRIL